MTVYSPMAGVTAIFGGAFDPPHEGHNRAIYGLFENPGVARVIVVPSALPPLKPSTTPAEHRLAMARLAFGPESRFPGPVEISSIEIERAKLNGRPSFSFDTISELKRLVPHLAFVIGIDQICELPRWYRFPELLGLCPWLVLARKGENHVEAHLMISQWSQSGLISPHSFQIVPTPAPAISSTQLREDIARDGLSQLEFLNRKVVEYLKQHHLYGIYESK